MGWGLCRHLRKKPGWGLAARRGSGGKLGTERDMGSKEGKGEEKEGRKEGRERERDYNSFLYHSVTHRGAYLSDPSPFVPFP